MSMDGIRVVAFDPRWREDFAALNIEWLQRWFVVEPFDREVLGNPEHYILADGGRILFAVDQSTLSPEGRNILIGGGGADVLTAGRNGDILIGGSTNYAAHDAALANPATEPADAPSEHA